MNARLKLQEMLAKDVQKVGTDLVPVHVSMEEVKLFNIMQGGQMVDETTGLRSYSTLSDVLKIPKIRNIFILVVDIIKSGKPIPEDIAEIMGTPVKGEDEEVQPIATDSDPEIQALAQTGDGDDKVLVMMPQDVVAFFDFIQQGEHKDKADGLQEFWGIGNFLKSVVRTVATVGGAVIGGPIGAGLGNMAGRALTGQKIGKDMLVAGAKNGLYAWGAQKALGALGGLGGLGGTSNLAGVSNVASSTAAPIVSGAEHQASIAATNAAAAKKMGSSVANTGSGGGLGSMLGGMGGYLGPAMLIGGGMYMSNKGEKKNFEEQKRMLEDEQRKRDEENRRKEERKHRMNQGLHGGISDVEIPRHSWSPSTYRGYKTGGSVLGSPIKGRGNGQDDFIHKNAKEKTWIWDATTVAHVGDGSSNAGHKAIKNFEHIVAKKLLPKYKEVIKEEIRKKPLRNVPCALSNDEYETKPEIVAAIGEGSFDKGGQVLRKMTHELRKHKASKGLNLPPAAHDLTVYYKKALRGK